MSIHLTDYRTQDRQPLYDLYRVIATIPGGIIREPDEITEAYIEQIVTEATQCGIMLIAREGEKPVGEIHAYTPSLQAFRHILTELTIVVHPDYQGQGIGKLLFQSFLEKVRQDFSHILRVELYTREHNQKNVAFYESLGFQNEGRQADKIMGPEGQLETPLHMVWFNPAFEC